MAESTSDRHGKACAAAVLALGSLIIAACSSTPGEPAPVYMMGMAGTAILDPAATAQTEPSMAPVALASWTEPSGNVGHTASDVIPLDDPPRPAAMQTQRASVPASTGAAPAAVAAPPPTGAAVEPSAAKRARAEAVPQRVRERTASEPARADLVTAGAGVPRAAPSTRPSYYWP